MINGGNGTDSGLNDSLTGDDILLRLNAAGTSIEGYVSSDPGSGFGDGTVAFTVSVDGSGNVTLDQSRAVEHLDGTNPDDSISSTTNTIGLKATVADKEGDTVDLTRDISGNLKLEDDGPRVTVTGNIPTLVTDDTDTPNDTDSKSFANIFTVSYGADGPKDVDENGADADALVYSLAITGGDGTASGLYDSLTGDAILLRANATGTVVEGYLTSDPGAGIGTGTVAFTITLDASTGNVTQKQDRSVEHDDSTDADESSTPATLSAANLITLTATAKDGDDGNEDSDSATANIGQAFTFKDDGPTNTGAADGSVKFVFTDSEPDGVPDTTNNDGYFSDTGFLDYGADGEGSFVFINYSEQMPDDTVLGPITETLSADNTKITYSSATYGDLFEITLDGTEPGGYAFVALQSAPVVLNPLGISSVDAGGPSETEVVQAPGGTYVTFDGFISTNFNGNAQTEYSNGNLPPPPAPDGLDTDDVNISTPGIGLKDNQMDPGEQLKVSFSQDGAGTTAQDIQGVQLLFEGGTGAGSTFDIRFVAYDGGSLVADVAYLDETLPKGNNQLLVDFLPGESFDVETDPFAANESFDEVFVFINFDGAKNGVRIKEVSLYEVAEIPDFSIDYETRATDGDGDYVDDSFTVQVDANNDGVFSIV